MSDESGGAAVIFTVEDVVDIRSNLSMEEATEAFNKVADRLMDRMTEIGWDILDNLLHMEGYSADDDEDNEDSLEQ